MFNMFIPGPVLTVDELMSQWTGDEGDYSVTGMPHVTKEIRKPVPVGMEAKCTADGVTGIMLRLDILEGKERQEMKKYVRRVPNANLPADPMYQTLAAANDVHNATTAQTLRLVEPWFGSNRVVDMDAWFASVMCTIALSSHGLYAMGIIKNGHSQYPKAYLANLAKTRGPNGGEITKGSHVVMTSEYTINGNSIPLMAVAWKDRTLKTIISNVGNTLPALTPAIRKRKFVFINDNNEPETGHYVENIARPRVIFELFTHFASIDIHNHMRQGVLNMERYWPTKSWWMRVFCTVLGIIVVNAYGMYKYEYKFARGGSDKDIKSFHNFVDELAYDLIHNDYNAAVPNLRNRASNNNVSLSIFCIYII
jgi:hypothetical protein